MTLSTLQSKAMKLSLKDRGKLAAALLASLDEADPKEVENMWLDEAEKRYQNLLAGRAKLVPADDAVARARKALRR